MINPEIKAKMIKVPNEKAIPLDFNTVMTVSHLKSFGIHAFTPGIFALM